MLRKWTGVKLYRVDYFKSFPVNSGMRLSVQFPCIKKLSLGPRRKISVGSNPKEISVAPDVGSLVWVDRYSLNSAVSAREYWYVNSMGLNVLIYMYKLVVLIWYETSFTSRPEPINIQGQVICGRLRERYRCQRQYVINICKDWLCVIACFSLDR